MEAMDEIALRPGRYVFKVRLRYSKTLYRHVNKLRESSQFGLFLVKGRIGTTDNG